MTQTDKEILDYALTKKSAHRIVAEMIVASYMDDSKDETTRNKDVLSMFNLIRDMPGIDKDIKHEFLTQVVEEVNNISDDDVEWMYYIMNVKCKERLKQDDRTDGTSESDKQSD